ncbi:MAG: leucyl-tRNA synthetase [Parcubacteria group bacterium Gr01-1014_66]|nr:MAG: leucyl-tRNA synthetase [Parcubacteria group bacterium Gr01-1014_66]
MSHYFPANIEKKWQAKWLKEKIYEPSFAKASKDKSDLLRAKKPFYNLMMFPYPSAEGLHIGGVRTFTGVDIYGRFKRMQGYDVFEPIGLDGFGIHSENYALKIGKHPVLLARVTEKNFYRQLAAMGNGFAWDERLKTYDSRYYRWTQWIFVQMFKRGLAYRKKASVNWCPSCKTVLANEQVVAGVCERCSAVVVKKELEQWFFRITKYAGRLLKNLETLDWSESVKIAQKEWIGKKEGINIMYPIDGTKETVTVFTTRPDTNFGATFVVLAPENALAFKIADPSHKKEIGRYIEATRNKSEQDRIAGGRKKTGVFTGSYALNHLTGYKMPIWVSDFVLSGFGTGAVVGVPGHDMRDFEFATAFNLEVIRVVRGSDGDDTRITRPEQVQEREGTMINSGFLNGMDIHSATSAVKDYIEEKGWGKKVVQYHLRDWLISRQRYWGPPIPMIFCENCHNAQRGERKDMPGWYAVLEKNLPVALPVIKNFHPTGTDQSPLASVEKFYKVRCPQCRQWARRETDVSDTFLDSAWYYLRYPSVRDSKRAWNLRITKKWLPVDMYIGGKEHSVLHLLYARFLAFAFYDWKMTHFKEPFVKFRSHGLVTKDGTKMSKSRGNVVSPDEYIAAYGADAMRMYLAFMAPLDQGGDFCDVGIAGITRFLNRVWKIVSEKRKTKNEKQQSRIKNNALQKAIHKTIKKVGDDIESLQYNTAISVLMMLLNEFEKNVEIVNRDDIAIFLKLLAPFAPHITEELWQMYFTKNYKLKTKNFSSVHREPWPVYQKKFLREDTREFAIQINGKLRDTFTAPAGIKEQEATRLTLAREKVKLFLAGREPKKIIFVPGRLVNIVV